MGLQCGVDPLYCLKVDYVSQSSDPNLVLASSLYGQLFFSNDGGGSWQKVRLAFSEVRSLAWMPS